MAIRTTAVELAAQLGWSKAELAERTGLSLSTVYLLARGGQPSGKAIAAIMRTFPLLPYERLFVTSDSDVSEARNRPIEAVA